MVRKLRLLSSLLIAALLVLSFAGQGFAAADDARESDEDREELELTFKDADEADWAVESIGIMKSKNVLSGYEDGSFRPNQAVSRVEAVVTAVRLMGLEEEAKAKSTNESLHFKDAALIDKQYKWAKGYIIVALEQGLFDVSEDTIQPSKAASRIWVAALLVKALGLEEDALSQMTVVPDFTDVKDIPAGAIGYVNVAVDQGIVSGYPDETFKPNRSVTRAELATLLVRTNDNLLEQSGAVTVTGTITAIQFDSEDDAESSVAGSITIESFNGDVLTYTISSALAVPFHDRFIPASELVIQDVVSLTVENSTVLEAHFIDKELIDETAASIHSFKLEIQFSKDNDLKLVYRNEHGKIKAEVEEKQDGKKEKAKGEEAALLVEAFLKEAALAPEMTEQEIVDQLLTVLEIEAAGFEELEAEIKFSNGTKIKIELENEEELPEADNLYGIEGFELSIELVSKQTLKIKYKYEDGQVEAKVEQNKEKASGEQAVLAVEEFFKSAAFSDDMDKEEIIAIVLAYFELEESDLKELELEIEFSSGKEVSIEFGNDAEVEDEDQDEDEDGDDDHDDDEDGDHSGKGKHS